MQSLADEGDGSVVLAARHLLRQRHCFDSKFGQFCDGPFLLAGRFGSRTEYLDTKPGRPSYAQLEMLIWPIFLARNQGPLQFSQSVSSLGRIELGSFC
jgi:hypothetical protein